MHAVKVALNKSIARVWQLTRYQQTAALILRMQRFFYIHRWYVVGTGMGIGCTFTETSTSTFDMELEIWIKRAPGKWRRQVTSPSRSRAFYLIYRSKLVFRNRHVTYLMTSAVQIIFRMYPWCKFQLGIMWGSKRPSPDPLPWHSDRMIVHVLYMI